MSRFDAELFSTTELNEVLGLKRGLSVDFIIEKLGQSPIQYTGVGALWTKNQKTDIAFALSEYILRNAGVDVASRFHGRRTWRCSNHGGLLDCLDPRRYRHEIPPFGASRAMKVYVSGPMTGIKDFNFPAFASAAKEMESRGYTAVNPATLNTPNTSWNDCMKADIRALVDCDAIVMLKGWERSNGAQIELNLAHRLGMEIMFFDELLEQAAA